VPAVTHERAPARISLPDRALDLCRHVSPVPGRAPQAGSGGCGEPTLLEVAHEERESLVEHFRDVPRGDAEQLLCAAQVVGGALPDRDLERKALGRERRHPGSWSGRLDTPRGLLAARLNTPRGVFSQVVNSCRRRFAI